MTNFFSGNILLIVLFPLFAAIFSFVNVISKNFASRNAITTVSSITGIFCTAASAILFFGIKDPIADDFVLFQSGNFLFTWGLLADKVGTLFLTIASATGLIVQIYSAGFFKNHPKFELWFTMTNTLCFAVNALILSSTPLGTFVFYAAVGAIIFMIVNFYYESPEAAKIARNVLITEVFGCCLLLTGLITIAYFATAQNPEIACGLGTYINLGSTTDDVYVYLSDFQYFAFCACLIAAFALRAGIFPFFTTQKNQTGAPSAIAGYLHTVVPATGILLFIRFYPIFENSPEAVATIFYIGLITAVLSSFSAISQPDGKKKIAFVSAAYFGFTTMFVGLSNFNAAIEFMTAAILGILLLSLFEGIFVKYFSNEEKISVKKNFLPVACGTAGIFALTALFFGGFFEKITETKNIYIMTAAGTAVFLSVYCLMSTFLRKISNKKFGEHRKISSRMKIGVIAAILSIPAFFAVDFDIFEEPLTKLAIFPEIAVAIIVAAATAAAFFCIKNKKNALPRGLKKLSEEGLFAETITDFVLTEIFNGIQRFFAEADKIPGKISRISGVTFRVIASGFGSLQNGNLQTYAAYSILAIGLLFTLFMTGFSAFGGY